MPKAKLAPITSSPPISWPLWAKVIASIAIIWQFTSQIAAELAQPPSSPLEQKLAESFSWWYEITDQGIAHRFYSDIGPTAILLAELRFTDGRPPQTIRFPNRSTRPRILYQRQLALANAVFEEYVAGLNRPTDQITTRRAQAIARYLARREPGCSGVVLRLQSHRNPEPGEMIEAIQNSKTGTIDVEAEEFYDIPRMIGDYPWPKP